MATEITGKQIKDGTIRRVDLDTTTAGQAVVRRIVAGTGVTLSSTGVDSGTGDVTINATGGGLPSLAGNANKILKVNSTADATEWNTIATGTSGTDFNIAHAAGTVTFNIPDASGSNRGLVTTGAQTFAGVKTFSSAPAFSNAAGTRTNLGLGNSDNVTFNTVTTGAISCTSLLMRTEVTASNVLQRSSADGFAAFFLSQKSRGTIASPASVNSGDSLGGLSWAGHDGTNFTFGAEIRANVDAAPNTGEMPTRLVFLTSPGTGGLQEAMRINRLGRVGIGTASPERKLDVYSESSDDTTYAFRCRNNAATVLVDIRSNGEFYTGQAGSSPYNSTTGSAANAFIASSGLLQRSTSSIKYKRDVEDYDKGLAEVLNLQPKYYKSVSEADGETVYAGLIAEDVHDLGLTEFVQYDSENLPDALAYSHMVALLVNAIKELKQEKDDLEARVATLEQLNN
jgi:hypothetical protein